MGYKRQEHTDGAVQFILLGEPDEMNSRENGPDPWTVYPWERWVWGDHRCGRKEVKAGAGLSRDRDRSICLLLGDNEVLINMLRSKVWVWDAGQGDAGRELSEANDRSETRNGVEIHGEETFLVLALGFRKVSLENFPF